MKTKNLISNTSLVGRLLRWAYGYFSKFNNSSSYWERRYASGGNSGEGSYDKLAEFKAEVINAFVKSNDINSVIEFGCGDGNQLRYAEYPQYTGFDVSVTALDLCRNTFAEDPSKQFCLMSEFKDGGAADLCLSLDVIYHLVEDEVFQEYMQTLFGAAKRYVIVYSSNDENIFGVSHVKHRNFSRWVEENCLGWNLLSHIPNRYRSLSEADFFIYQRK
ncbi:hypothetical protein AGMMS49960_09720 [Betaproteobacteria bacterium]|nr:hypothetical protein AGMMS49960_09720 [Betaproteobacteria bacterium]